MTSSHLFDTVEKVAAFVNYRCKENDYSDMGEMLVTFFMCPIDKVKEIYWIYELEDENGVKGIQLDYSLRNGGGWLNVGLDSSIFLNYLQDILKFDMSDDVRKEITERQQKLKEAITDAINQSVLNTNPPFKDIDNV